MILRRCGAALSLVVVVRLCSVGAAQAGEDGVCKAGEPGCNSGLGEAEKAEEAIDPKQEAKAQKLIAKAQAASGRQDFKTSYQLFAAVAKRKGLSAQLRSLGEINAGISLHMLKDNDKAVQWLTKALETYSEETLRPNKFYAVLSLSNAHVALENFDAADVHYASLRDLPEFANRGLQVRATREHANSLLRTYRRGKSKSSHFRDRDVLKEAADMLAGLLGHAEKVPMEALINLVSVLDDAGRHKARKKLLKWAVKDGYILNVWQYPNELDFNLPVPASPWWDAHDRFPILQELEMEWKDLRQEYDSVRDSPTVKIIGDRVEYDRDIYNHADGGRWSEFTMFHSGSELKEATRLAPLTAGMFRDEARVTRVQTGQVVFSVLAPRTRVRKHCGPTNQMITCHLGIHIPSGGMDTVGISVAGKKRQWTAGKVLCFEDSMEHEVWNDSDEMRVALVFNVKHPALW